MFALIAYFPLNVIIFVSEVEVFILYSLIILHNLIYESLDILFWMDN
jgi:hypothetical protein